VSNLGGCVEQVEQTAREVLIRHPQIEILGLKAEAAQIFDQPGLISGDEISVVEDVFAHAKNSLMVSATYSISVGWSD
jgi:hypothetical protein